MDLEVRPPKQRRSREAWQRVLDAGVAILEDGGYDAFTIAAVCARARVAPPAIYARTTSKDALFLAVYVLIASLTETGFSDASTYLLELTLAASLVMPSAFAQDDSRPEGSLA